MHLASDECNELLLLFVWRRSGKTDRRTDRRAAGESEWAGHWRAWCSHRKGWQTEAKKRAGGISIWLAFDSRLDPKEQDCNMATYSTPASSSLLLFLALSSLTHSDSPPPLLGAPKERRSCSAPAQRYNNNNRTNNNNNSNNDDNDESRSPTDGRNDNRGDNNPSPASSFNLSKMH